MSEADRARDGRPFVETRDNRRAELVRGKDGDAVVRVTGSWHLRRGIPLAEPIEAALGASQRPQRLAIDVANVTAWDSSLVSFIVRLDDYCREHGIVLARDGLPPGLRRLIELAETAPASVEAGIAEPRANFVVRLGVALIAAFDGAEKWVEFVGMVAVAMANFVRGRARFRASDLIREVQACGANALGIVSLISYLVGVILAYMGAVQLQQFGAAIYVADLVGIGMVREMGAMMTAIIMAGRTGAAFAAQLGSMKVTQEIDAFSTMGISPMEFLVLPRIIALILMMPLLCLYSDFIGILGGATVGVAVLGVSLSSYWHETVRAITLTALTGGLVKSATYGVLIAVAGCYQGFECGKSSAAVGEAATSAVVSAIVMIVVACGMFAVLFNILGI